MNIALIRKINAIICAVAIVFFLVHGIMGTVMAVNPYRFNLVTLAWIGCGLLVIHVILAVVITMNKKNDPNPPSKAKHAFQWITGTAIVVLVLFHSGLVGSSADGIAFVSMRSGVSLGIMIGLMAALLAHVCINVKSMFEDMGMNTPEKAASARKHALYMAVVVGGVFAVLAVVLVLQFV